MKLTLALPALFRPADDAPPLPELPAFNQILRYGRVAHLPRRPSEFYARHLWRGSLLAHAKAFAGLPPEQPAAFASPVWQQMGMHQASIVGGEYLHIDAEEAARLCTELSAFYREDGWTFHVVRPDLWLLAKPSESDWQVAPLPDVCGQVGSSAQACGADALEWLAKQTEIQMWLHAHPVNQTRAAQGLPALNGLWLWQDATGEQTADWVAASSPWAQFAEGEKIDAPYNFAALLAHIEETARPVSEAVVWLDDLAATVHMGDVSAYCDILESWETHWFAPLLGALRTGRVRQLAVETDGEQGGSLVLTRRSLRAFWKKRRVFRGTGWA
ncbi:hypothetical protein [Bergeriella denitrificans]|nr:hypothetical protein [Bergeriella denitrificans]